MSNRTTSKVTRNATSSPESADGPGHLGSRCGLTKDMFGQEAAPASRSQSLQLVMAERKASAMKGISGRNFVASSQSESLTQSLANRLMTRLDGGGGTPRQWTLRRKHTPAR